MARILALDWDRREARCVLASVSGQTVQMLLAASVPILDVAQGGNPSHPDIGGSLRAVLSDHRLGWSATVVGINRSSVELLNLTLPPASDAELARLVAHQAAREAQSIEAGATLDFVAMNRESQGPREVTAAILSAEQRQQVQEAAGAAGLKPAHIVLRPLAAASLFARLSAPSEGPNLLVNLVADEADLTVISEGQVVYLRTVRLPEEAGEKVVAERLSAEIGRTLLVAQQGPLRSTSVDSVFVYSGSDEHAVLVDQLRSDLAIPVATVDPFDRVDDSAIERPAQAGRFASLLGMILDEANNAHAIDFLHPRRPPRPPNRRRQALAIAAAVLALALAGGWYFWDQTTAIDRENVRLAGELKGYDDLLKRQAQDRQLVAALRQWSTAEVLWLEELRDLSLRFPPSRDALLMRMSLAPGAERREASNSREWFAILRSSTGLAQRERRPPPRPRQASPLARTGQGLFLGLRRLDRGPSAEARTVSRRGGGQAMNKHRQKLLVGLFVLVLVVFGWDRIWATVGSYVTGPLDARRARGEKLSSDIQKRLGELKRARKDAQELADWKKQSLPSDPVAARAAYQAWLLDVIKQTELQNAGVTLGDAVRRSGALYASVSASVQARGTLEQWTRFLYEFYGAGHLHQIRSISINPLGRKGELNVALSIEALLLPGVVRKELSRERSRLLAFDRLEDYAVIAQRNFFGSSGTADPTDHTYLTAIQEVNGEAEAWFTLRAEGDPERALTKVRRGESLEIGQFRGTVLAIEGNDVILDADGQRWLVALGETLAQAFALPPGLP